MFKEGFVPDVLSAVGHVHQTWTDEGDPPRIVTFPIKSAPDAQLPRPTIAGLIVQMGLSFESFEERLAALEDSEVAEVGDKILDLVEQYQTPPPDQD